MDSKEIIINFKLKFKQFAKTCPRTKRRYNKRMNS